MKLVKARKEHKCRWRIAPNCKTIIRIGDLYKPIRLPSFARGEYDGICIACLEYNESLRKGAKEET